MSVDICLIYLSRLTCLRAYSAVRSDFRCAHLFCRTGSPVHPSGTRSREKSHVSTPLAEHQTDGLSRESANSHYNNLNAPLLKGLENVLFELGSERNGQPFHSQEWSISNFSCILTGNIAPHSMKNLAFHSLLRWKMIILPILITSLIHFSLGRLGECTFWTWEWKKGLTSSLPRVINFKFLLQPHRKYCIPQYEELGFS